MVTGTGPLAGAMSDSHGHRTTVPRFHFALQDVTQPHAGIDWFIGALAVAPAIGPHFTGAPARSVRYSRIVLRRYRSTRERQPRPAVATTRAGPVPATRNPQAPGVAQGAEGGVR